MIKVVNVKSYKEGGIYIGRSIGEWKGSVLGNPFRIGKDGDREEVIKKYLVWLRGEWRKRGEVYWELMRLVERNKRGECLVLMCWCHPQHCHGDVLKEVIEKLSK